MKVALIFDGRCLQPVDEAELETLRSGYVRGELVQVDVKKARHLAHHKLHFARFREIVKQGLKLYGNRFHNADALRAFVYVCVGWCETYQCGPVSTQIPRTVKWDAVDQTAFKLLDQNVVLFLAEELSPPLDSIVTEANELIARGVERSELRDAA